MSYTVTLNFTANPGGIALDGSKFYGPPAELAGNTDFQHREPAAFAVAQEFMTNGTTSGTVTITAA